MSGSRHLWTWCLSALAACCICPAAFGGPAVLPKRLELGRVYRASTKVATLELSGAPHEELELSLSQPQTPTGSRAAGLFARTTARTVRLGADGRATVRVELVVQAAAYTGAARVVATVSDAHGRSSEAEIIFESAARALEAPKQVDFGKVFPGGRSSAKLALILKEPDRLPAWLDWTGLVGDWGEILPAFIKPARRDPELVPEERTEIGLELCAPRGARPGRYEGLIKISAGPHKVDCAAVVEVEPPKLFIEPAELALAPAGPERTLSGELTVRLEAALPERLELGFAGPLHKLGRPESVFEGVSVSLDGDGLLGPGEALRVRLEGELPAGQEDGLYEGELLARAGAARARAKVRLEVRRPEGLAPFELDPPSLTIWVGSDGEGVGALRIKSNEDTSLQLDARVGTADAWELFLEGSPPYVLPPRGELELVVVARPHEGSPRRGQGELAIEGGGISRRVELTMELALPGRPEGPSPRAVRSVLAAIAFACALAGALAWRARPFRYAFFSAGIHALALTIGIRSPFLSMAVRPLGAQAASLVRVIQVPDPYGEPAQALAGSPPAGIELPSPEPLQELAELPPAGGGALNPVPAHPDVSPRPEDREAPELARAVRPGPALGPSGSDGFDREGPEASLSLLESGELVRARLSEPEEFGALAELALPGAVSRGAPALVEVPNVAAVPAPRERVEAPAPPSIRAKAGPLEGPPRELAELKPQREVTPSSAMLVRKISSSTEVPVPERPTAARPPLEERPQQELQPLTVAPEQRPIRTLPPDSRKEAVPPEVFSMRFSAPEEKFEPPPRELARADTPRAVPVSAARIEAVRPLPEERPEQLRPAGEAKETGTQTITRAMGDSPAGVRAGGPEESFSSPTLSSPLQAMAPGALARAGPVDGPGPAANMSLGASPTGRARALRARIDLGILKHSGEWAVCPRAMTALARALIARLPGFSLEPSASPVSPTDERLFDCAFVYLTGRKDPALNAQAQARLRMYLERGGFLWVDDGSPPGDDTFDRAWRDLARTLMPKAALRRLPAYHAIFSAPYDLSRGYLGRSPPFGAWAKGDVEGLFGPDGRLVAVYTRNGYGRALEVDPDADISFVPPAGLTPREAKEGALRFGVNLAAYVLRSHGEVLPAQASAADDPAARYRYRGAPQALRPAPPGIWEVSGWRVLADGAPARLSGRDGLSLDIAPSEKDWAGMERTCPEELLNCRALVLDVKTRLSSSGRLAVRLRASDGTLFETVPLYIRSAAIEENLRVPLDAADFRSSATGWKGYDAPLDRTKRFVSIAFVVYAKGVEGTVEFSRLRLEGW